MLGIIISIVLGIAGIICTYLFALWQVKKNKIVHFTINSYDIGKGLSDEFPEFKLHYDGENLSNNVKVLKGGFANVGRNDINSLKGNSDIRLVLPKDCAVKAVVVSQSSDGLGIIAEEDKENKNVINFGINELFKTNEFFKYTAIVETSKEIENLYEMLKFQHRISNTDIKNIYLGVLKEFYRRNIYKKFKKLVFALFAVFMVAFPLILSQRIDVKFVNKTSGKEAKLILDYNSQIHVVDNIYFPFFNEGKIISTEEMNNDYKICPILKYKWYNKYNWQLISLFIISILYIVICYYILFWKHLWGDRAHIMEVLYPNKK